MQAIPKKTELPLIGGTAKFNFGTLGIAKYNELSIKGFALPREVAIGAAFKPNADLLLSAKIDWINWADAINDVTTRWSDTSSTFAPAVMVDVRPQDWSNQLVYALGAAYTYNEKTTLYAGYNYGKNPVPKNNSSD